MSKIQKKYLAFSIYEQSEVDALVTTTSGDIVSQIPTDFDDQYYTETELDNGQLNSIYYTEAEVDALLVTVSGSGKGGISWTIVSGTSINCVKDYGYLINASNNDVLLHLPTTPSEGDIVGFCDVYNMATTNTITISGSCNIEGSGTPFVLDSEGAGLEFVYCDETRGWEIVNEVFIKTTYVTDDELTTVSGIIVSQIPTDFYSRAEVDTISGSLNAEIDSDISTHASSADHDGRYYTETEITTISGNIVDQIPSDFYSRGEVDTISGSIIDQIPSVAGLATESYVDDHNWTEADITDLQDYALNSKVDTASGTLQDEIDNLDYYTTSEVDGLIPSDFYTQAEVTTISGNIVSQFPTDFYSQAEITTISGDIVGQIPSIVGLATETYVDEHTWDESDITDLDKYTQAEVDTISGSIVAQIPAAGMYNLVDDTAPELGGDLDTGAYTVSGTGTIITGDHGTAATAEVVNVCYGTGDPLAASTTTIGTLYIKYTA